MAASKVWEPDANGLLPCPFCGGNAVLRDGDFDWFVACEQCYIYSPSLRDEAHLERDTAIAAWNRRSTPQQQPLPIPDDPDSDMHRQRWVRIDWDTLVALEQMLAGNTSPVMRTLVEMLVRQAQAELETAQPAPVASVPDEVREAIDMLLELAKLRNSEIDRPECVEDINTIDAWLDTLA